ncbi:MAG TPA: dipeptide epimerase [Ktedonobacterales bacterium]|nr:dipeptide epimerase [Ktedonobacterales bacterium]
MARVARTPTTIVRLDADPLNIALHEPFTIATGHVDAAHNVLVRVTLADGTVGLGEAAPFPPSGGESQETALAAVRGMTPLVEGHDAASWRPLSEALLASFEHQATARAGVEAAILDALTRSWGIPLFQIFGGVSSHVETDISIPIVSPGRVAELAREHAQQGAVTLKLKVGTDVDDDTDRVLALVEAAPDCDLILDGNQGYTPSEALELLRALEDEDVEPILFEQPVHRHDLEGLRFVTERAGIPVAADESVQTAADALRIARMGAANVINIKLMKAGIVEALNIAAVCHAAHIDLMIGAMIESRLGVATSAHFAAGLGGFHYIDLDTAMLLADDPFAGGYDQSGMTLALDYTQPGHGVRVLGTTD